jgi:predicted MFS family arabinose efflux permease
MSRAHSTADAEVRRALLAVLIARSAINGALRVVYPFLPAIGRGLGVSLNAVAAVVAVRNLGGLAAPLGAWASERSGRRSPMLLGIAAVAGGCLLTASTRWFGVAAAGIVIVGVAKSVFDVEMQAWFGDRVAYRERGRVFGVTELAWPLGLIVTVPASGLLIERLGWQAPFVLAGVLSLAGAVVVGRLIAPDRPERHIVKPLALTSDRAALLGVVLLFSASAELIFVVYGEWLESSMGLSVAGIGLFTIAVVAAELAGEAAVTLVADRLGLRRMTLAGLGASALGYLALGLVGRSLLLAVVVVIIWVAAFEVTIVAAVPLASEVAPESRDRLLSLFSVAVALGRAVGALAAPPLYAAGGIALNGLVAAAGALAAAAILGRLKGD